jgi:PhnB protein
MSVTKIPEGFATVTPTLIFDNAGKAIALYKKAFGATEDYRMASPDGKIMHACITIGSSKVFVCDVNPGMACSSPSQSGFYLYMDDVDATFTQASKAGLEEISPVQDMFWGDRVGAVKDAFGIHWTIATHVRDVSKDEMDKSAKKMFNQAA